MQSRKISADKKGSLLVELAVALAISSITFTALASLAFVRQSFVFNLSERRESVFQIVSDIESVRALADKSFTSIPESSLRKVENINACLERVISSNKNFSLEISIPNIPYAKNIDGDCGGNSDNVSSSPSISTLSLSGLSGSTDALKNIVAVGTRADDASEFRVYSTSVGTPLLVSLPMPTSVNALDLVQKYAYLASDGPDKQFSVVDMNNPTNPQIISSISLPGVSGSSPNATSIFYYNKKVYIGVHRTAGHEFHIFDASSANPFWLSSVELNHNVNAITVREPYAFLATSGNTKNLIVLDVSNPNTPSQIASLAFSGAEDSLSIFLSGDKLYIGRKKSTKTTEPDFVIVDIKNPLNPTILGSLTLKKDITGIRVANNYAFLSTPDGSATLVVLDVSNPTAPKIVSSFGASGPASGIDIENDTVFLLTQ